MELVNLLLTGKAVSNVFNNVIELDSGNGNITILKGITSRSDIGLLSLFEHYDVCQANTLLLKWLLYRSVYVNRDLLSAICGGESCSVFRHPKPKDQPKLEGIEIDAEELSGPNLDLSLSLQWSNLLK
ncbi:protein hypothetical protein [Limosa lapponica baueri]|uniref:Ubiquitin carboxyl-terminal hydrolase MINDY n=1 Tax=Limosa lapponica baueri TaxID=1758121 RepID=A0A2I0TFM5_LIMLA|nr:protein hypothetical protein [Limosa lapponica baueri]